MAVDGRLMVCSGSSCGSILDSAVDETMGDLGVEGKVVAGAFEGYCDDGWVWVPGSSKYGTLPGFCVMTGKADSSFNSVIDGTGSPLVNISQGEAQFACQSIGLGYHLLSENEWMTIADNIIKVGDNDIDNNTSGMQLAFGLDNFSYKLTNDNIIYDLAGSIGEWTDQTITNGGMITPLIDIAQEYSEITNYQGFNIAPPYYYDSANGIGTIITGNNLNNLRGFVRGQSGVYGLDLSKSPATISDTIGFRCAK
jgi:hypothetical protein